MTEIRTGAWLLEALRLRLASAVSPVTRDGAEYDPGQERPDPRTVRANEELRCVLEIMDLFSANYISGDEDGIPSLKKTLDQLRSSDWFTELGSEIDEKLNYLKLLSMHLAINSAPRYFGTRALTGLGS